ncbi:MAG: flagellar basal-body rod protein FlgG [Planctomycetes bacterium]|nr:flagellar basal-body rod protein FlgG [Planctomycetota bacterium]
MGIGALSTAATGMRAQQTRIDVLANNLANATTTGFKRSRAEFEDLIYQNLRRAGTQAIQAAGTRTATGIQVGTGSRLISVAKEFKQGAFERTDNDLDLAIEGDGFFRLQLQGGQFGYTRAGTFHRDVNGNMVTPQGYILDPPVTVPQDVVRLFVSVNGVVEGQVPGQTTAQNLGTIELSRFSNPEGLEAAGENLYVETEASGPAISGQPGLTSLGLVRQGFLEQSNVDVVRELVTLIQSQRAYEINAQAIQTADAMLQVAGNLKR